MIQSQALGKAGSKCPILALAWSFHSGEIGEQTHGQIVISVPEMYSYSSSSVEVTSCDSAEALVQIYTILHRSDQNWNPSHN